MDLLERDGLLDELRRLLHEAGESRGCLLLIGGEAGVGKTALVRRFAEEARATASVMIGQCDALSTPRALGPLFDVATADPALQRLLSDNAPRDLLFRTMLSRLKNGRLPVMLIIEDAHWADEATLDLLRYLGRRIEDARSLTIVTYRDDEVGLHHSLRHVLGDLATTKAVRRLTIPPLTADGVALLAAGSYIDSAALYARTRGNPFFVTEVLAAVGDIPATVSDAVLTRAGRLPSAAWVALEAAAVIGSPIDPDLFQWVAGTAPDDLDDLMASGMLLDQGGILTFRHELAREAILSAVTPLRRAAIHARVLQALERACDASRDLARLAHHAEGAGDGSAVLRYASEAARQAALLHAHRESANQYARALRFAARLPPEERARLLEAQSFAYYMTAQIDRAMPARTEALAIWRQLGNVRKEGENRCHLASLLWAEARVDDAEHEAETAVAMLEPILPGPELALAYGTLARLRGTTLNDDETILLAEKAIALAERFGATETHIDALITLGESRLARGAIESGQQQIEMSMRRSMEAGLDELTARAYISLGYGFAESGRFDIARHHFERGIRYCGERDLALPLHHMTALLARCHLSLGNWDEACRLSRSVLNAREVAPGSRFAALLIAGLLRARRGDIGAGPLLDEAVALATVSGCIYFMGPVRAARAEEHFLSGNVAGSTGEARVAYDLAVERGHKWYTGELAYWRWKGGELAESPPNIAEPFALQIGGNWEAAASAWDALGCPYEAARARAEGPDEAALRASLSTFETLGAGPAAALVRGRLRELGARGVPRGPRRTTRANAAGLTPREIDVVALLAHGHGNQTIADRLYLSTRTVENHVAAILSKLDATNRSEAMTRAMQLGIIPLAE